MRTRVIVVAALAFLLLIPQLSLARGYRRPAGEGCLEFEDRVELKKLRLEHQLASVDLKAELEQLREKMHEELSKDDPSRRALEKIADEMHALKKMMMKKRIDHLLDVRKVLSAEEWKEFMKHHRRMGAGRHESGDRGRMMMRCPGSRHGAGKGRGHGPGRCGGHGRGDYREIKIIKEEKGI